MNIGEKISYLRKKEGMTQKELAEKLSVTDKAISRWESGIGNPDLNTLPIIAEVFNVSVDYLFSDNLVENQNNNAAEKKKKMNKKQKIILLLSAIFIVLSTAIVTSVILISENIKNKNFYYKGIQYLENYQFSEARDLFNDLNYKDSNEKYLLSLGLIQMKNASETKNPKDLKDSIYSIVKTDTSINTSYEGNGKFIMDDKVHFNEILNKIHYELLVPQNSYFSKWNILSFYYLNNDVYLYLSAVWK